jgi:Flp pilus assembly protein TadD
MTRIAPKGRMIALAASTALVSLALSGCATQAAPRADLSAGKAQRALENGSGERAVTHAEAAVLAEPRNAAYRAMLGAAYMEAGRFQSAATSFDDALTLGDTSPRTALGLALARIAAGDSRGGLATLEEWRADLDPADLGLALALAGQPDRGVHVLGNALRNGQNTPKVRQNLAYAYALAGDWRAARLMAAEDVPADQLDQRIGEWAVLAHPDNRHARVAALLAVPVVADSGQPVALALHNNPGTEALALEAAGDAAPAADFAYAAPQGELPPVAALVPQQAPQQVAPVQADFAAAFPAPAPLPAPTGAAPAQVAADAVRFATAPVVQEAPVARTVEPRRVAKPTPVKAAPVKAVQPGTHLVQLGSFSSEASAKRAWGIYAKRYPQLSDHDMVITKAVVRGKTYFRVSADGFGRDSSRSMCSTVKRGGEGCIAWAAKSPLPGAVDRGVRMASR